MIQVNYNELQENPDGDYQRNPASITTVVNEFVDEQYSLEINVEGQHIRILGHIVYLLIIVS